MNKKKIAYVVGQMDTSGGRERVLANRANYIVREWGWQVFIVTMHQADGGSFFPLEPGIKLVHLNISPDDCKDIQRLQKIFGLALGKIHSDITVSMWWDVEVQILPKMNDGSRKILEYHFCREKRWLALEGCGVVKRLWRRLKLWNEEQIIDKYDKFVLLTEQDRKVWNKQKGVTIANPVADGHEESAICSNHILIAAGRLDGQKNFCRLINCWAKIPDRADWQLHIYGEGLLRPQLESQIERLGLDDVRLMGNTPDLKSKMLSAGFCAMTSVFEGLPMVMLEAVEYGLPVVSMDFPCGPRDIIENSKTGYICGDEEEMASKMRLLMTDETLRRTMGKNGRERAMRLFNESCIMEKWRMLYEHI